MRRGFLKAERTPRAAKGLSDVARTANINTAKAVINDLQTPKVTVVIPTGRPVPKQAAVPDVGNVEIKGPVLNLNVVTLPRLPPVFNFLTVLCIFYEGTKQAILDLPGFPAAWEPAPSPPRYQVGTVDYAGKGVLATADIDAGDLIMRERPLLILPGMIPTTNGVTRDMPSHPDNFFDVVINSCMEASLRPKFLALKNCKGPEMSHIRGIIDTNSLSIHGLPGPYDGIHTAVPYEISRFNHSCSPNATYHWDLLSFTLSVRALRPIRVCEEITISYLTQTDLLDARANRQKYLAGYSFVCACSSCSLPAQESRRSDIRRSVLAKHRIDPSDERELKEWVANQALPDDYITKQSLRMMDIMEEEGLFDDEIWPAHVQRLCKAYCALSNSEEARKWAKKAVGLTRSMTGSDGGWERVAAAPEQTNWWGKRAKND